MPPLGISVVICCYNSEDRLPQTLLHLYKQCFREDILWEIIVVDNNSEDNTVEILKKELVKYDFSNLTLTYEEKSGLSNARLKGISQAVYEFILFCDDDNWLDEHYVQRAYDIMRKNNKIGVLGGRGEAVSDVELPHWFSTFQENFAVGVPSLNSGDVTYRGFLWGAGMVVRKSEIKKLLDSGFTFLCSGRQGDLLLAGDDSEICKWFILAGYRLWYDESLFFKHYIPETRLTKDYLEGLHVGFRKSHSVLKVYDLVIRRCAKKLSWRNKTLRTFNLGINIFFNFLMPGYSVEPTLQKLQYLYPGNNFFRVNKRFYEIYRARIKYFSNF